MYQKILSSEFAERRFDPRRRFTGQMPDVKGICQEGCYVSLHYGLNFQKTKITKQKTCYRILQVFPFLQSWYVLNLKLSFFHFCQKILLFSQRFIKVWCLKASVFVVVVFFFTAFERFKTLWANFFNHRCFETATKWFFSVKSNN